MLCTLKNRQQQTCRVILAYIVALNWICDFYFPSGLLFGRCGWSHQHSSCPRAGGPRPTSPHGSHDLLNMSDIHQPSFHTDRGTMHSLASFPVHSQIVSHSHGDKIDLFVTFCIVTRVEHICCSQVIAASGTVSKLSTTVGGICKVATTNTGNALVSKEFRRFMTRMTDSTATLLECTEVSGYKYIEHLIQ